MVKEHTLYNFSPLRFMGTYFTAYYTVYSGECSLCTIINVLEYVRNVRSKCVEIYRLFRIEDFCVRRQRQSLNATMMCHSTRARGVGLQEKRQVRRV